MPWHGEDDLDVLVRKPLAERPCEPKSRMKIRPATTGDRERQVDQRDQQALAAKIELGNRPGSGHTEHDVEGQHGQRNDDGQPDRRAGFRFLQGFQINRHPLRQAPRQNRHQRQSQEEEQEAQTDRQQGIAHPARFLRGTIRLHDTPPAAFAAATSSGSLFL
jgi:hypothetical protein